MKILVATDGSKQATHAVKYAAMLCGRMTAPAPTVTLISVHDDAGLRHARRFVGDDEIKAYLHEMSEKDLKSAGRLLAAAGIKFDTDIRIGHVAQEIVGRAAKGKYGLVVLGTKGRGALADLVVGSVAQRVLATCDVPVLLVK